MAEAVVPPDRAGLSTIDIWAGVAHDGPPVSLTLVPPAGAPGRARPAVVVLPGGGYHMHADHEAEPVAAWLGALGVAGFVLRYRVAPHRHPAALEDAERAIRLVRARGAEWGVDPDRVGVLGFSAGGHVAALVSCGISSGRAPADAVDERRARPDAAVLCYALIGSGDIDRYPEMAATLLGPHPDPAVVASLGADTRVDAGNPPTFLWHTADDEVLDVRHALSYGAALAGNDVRFALHVFPHGRHGLGLAPGEPEVQAWPDICAGWLAELGWAGPAIAG